MKSLIRITSALTLMACCIQLQSQAQSVTAGQVKSVRGHRFSISGDFNGDGKHDTVKEVFLSKKTKQEAAKWYKGLNDDAALNKVLSQKPVLMLVSDNRQTDTLFIGDNLRPLGFRYLKNEGDLDNDGADELSYVIDAADYSNINVCFILSVRNGKWTYRYSFDIAENWLPSLPCNNNKEKTFDLIKKIGKKQIRVRTYDADTGEAEFNVVDLSEM
ncbi:hypothetical protein HHL16_15790 [Pseudoflavitalea sp. G-6-1-2]|uniref:hypothetical protein n=1 Tax=Pseudoflavitalea sp. G-6-1-2 TaxID=2728841 RepID=UPI00146A6605|nr:hypothetical protein [Pseudoflavitalea sp. G-6-1-2]NML22345.1 hypothetical protein [Pseudoflavitalea sp. G-6-1-2]